MTFYKQILKNLPQINDIELQKYIDIISKTRKDLVDKIKSRELPPLNISFQNSDLKDFTNTAIKIKKEFKKVIILGVGGSSLGAKTIAAIKDDHEIEIDFFESIDGNTIKNKINKIKFEETFFLVISKSGQTIETICQSLIIIDQLKQTKIDNIADQFLFVTQNEDSDIGKIAKEVGSQIKPHPRDIGGRFSYLTIVGLLPAALIGCNINKIRSGAAKTLEKFINEDDLENDITKICAYQLYLFDKGFGSNVIMPYIDKLKDFTDWYRQLWAESLGKEGFGSTPINSMGTVDQHSQLQLYLDGPRDKFFTFIINKNHQDNFLINDLESHKTRFGNKKLTNIVRAEQESTIDIIANQNLPIRVIELDKIDEEILSSLMMQMFIETILIANAKKINPFDQPAVEKRKMLSKEYLDSYDNKKIFAS